MKREDVKSKIPGITDEQLDWLMGENGKDVNAANTRASTLQDQLDGVKAQLRTANDGLKASKSQDADITAALDALAKDSGYLFESAETPPPYAAGTGTAPIHGSYDDRLWAAAGLQPKT